MTLPSRRQAGLAALLLAPWLAGASCEPTEPGRDAGGGRFDAGTSGSDRDGDDCPVATPIEANTMFDRALDAEGDYDFFRLELTQPGTLTVWTSGGTDTLGGIAGPDCVLLVMDDDSGDDLNYRVSMPIPAAGTYFVAVTGATDSIVGPYTLHVVFEPRASGGVYPPRCSYDMVLFASHRYGDGMVIEEPVNTIVQWRDGAWSGNVFTYGDVSTCALGSQALTFTLSADRQWVDSFEAVTNHGYCVRGSVLPVVQDSATLGMLRAEVRGEAACDAIDAIADSSTEVVGIRCDASSYVQIWCTEE